MITHEYITQSGNVTLERWNDGEAKSLEFIYDNGGAPYSVIYTHGSTSETYYYILNQQGDVIRIVDGNGRTAAEYTYNGWGEILGAKQATGTIIGELNPIRYRGYYYDSELNMYYLQSRYYDPVVKRMLSADDESLTAGATLNNNNLFVYCDNDPVDRADGGGEIWNVVAGIAAGAIIEAACEIIEEGQIHPDKVLLAACASAFPSIGGEKIASGAIAICIDVAMSTVGDMNSYALEVTSEGRTPSAGEVGTEVLKSVATNAITAGLSAGICSNAVSSKIYSGMFHKRKKKA